MHDLTANGIYPKDVYDHRGFDYYGRTGEKYDADSFHKAVNKKDKPYSKVMIYRAVPKDRKIKSINPGDWVSHSREYAMSHGRSMWGSKKYKVLTASARARELFTDGNSIHEWGYHPQEADEGQHKHDAEVRARVAEKQAQRKANPGPSFEERVAARLAKIKAEREANPLSPHYIPSWKRR